MTRSNLVLKYMAWDPELYLSFEGPRFRPVLDLIAQITADAPARIADLGCGTGSGTIALRTRFPRARLTGIDGSAEMLEKARGDAPDIDWVQADLNTWQADQPFDVIFSNAALHWLSDHETLFPRLAASVAPGGQLAVQMPRNYHAPALKLVPDTARDGPWAAKLEPIIRPIPVQEPKFYYDLLAPRVNKLNMWETEFIQVLEGDNPVADWTKSTWLSPLLNALEEPDRGAFETEYRRRVLEAYPPEADGKTLFPFRRLFFVATL